MPSNLIDFSDYATSPSFRGGQSGKLELIHEKERYFLKFGRPNIPRKHHPSDDSYIDSPASEWLGCRVFGYFGIPVQDTIPGLYEGRTTVACKDFLVGSDPQASLIPFGSVAFAYRSSYGDLNRGMERSIVSDVLENSPALEPVRAPAIRRFWQTAIVDAIIGNYDRHGNNWGYIAIPDDETPSRIVDLAPVYDCASSFMPMMSKTAMDDYLDHPEKLTARIAKAPKTCMISDGEWVSYPRLLLSDYAVEGRVLLLDMLPDIMSLDIGSIIDGYPLLPSPMPEFFELMVETTINVNLMPAIDLARREEIERRRAANLELDESPSHTHEIEEAPSRPPAVPITAGTGSPNLTRGR